MNSKLAGPLNFLDKNSTLFLSTSMALMLMPDKLRVSVRAPIPGPISKKLSPLLGDIDCPISKMIAGSER